MTPDEFGRAARREAAAVAVPGFIHVRGPVENPRPLVPGSFTCPCCGAVSYHPKDIEFGYCGRCHWFTGDPNLGPGHLAEPCAERKAKEEER